jgi:hypothetical protein
MESRPAKAPGHTNANVSNCPDGFTKDDNRDSVGNDQYNMPIQNGTCGDLCSKDINCPGFVSDKTGPGCWIKKSMTTKTKNDTKITCSRKPLPN